MDLLLKELKKLFVCFVCKCELNDLRTLSCMHSFCASCLKSSESFVTCPIRECWKMTFATDPYELPKNPELSTFITLFKTFKVNLSPQTKSVPPPPPPDSKSRSPSNIKTSDQQISSERKIEETSISKEDSTKPKRNLFSNSLNLIFYAGKSPTGTGCDLCRIRQYENSAVGYCEANAHINQSNFC